MDTLTPVRPVNVLVVDDNPDAAESLALVLGQAGHVVRVAGDGFAALDAAREARPDVVLLDLGMPGMNGFEAARRLREDPAACPALLVAVTGWDGDDDRRRTRAAGFDHHLTKPADPERVLALIGEFAASRAT
ncbi:MAG TPA: response regulator [Gemmataceae bacterium]|nr:response regulator [Gemmataceae bacterium]